MISNNEPEIRMVISDSSLVNPFLPLFWRKSIPHGILALEVEVQDNDENCTATSRSQRHSFTRNVPAFFGFLLENLSNLGTVSFY